MGEAQSIMLAPYPTGIEAWRDPEAEGRMAAVKDTIHAARSLRAQYGLTPQVSGPTAIELACAHGGVGRSVSPDRAGS